MKARSAGVLLFRRDRQSLAVLLVHPGGPLWSKKDRGAWQIPKGEIRAGEDALVAAMREAQEELGMALPSGAWPLATIRQAGGKVVEVFALEHVIDASEVSSNDFQMEWPPRSGRRQSFPEVDRAEWFEVGAAAEMILSSQQPLLVRLVERLA